MTSDSRFVFDTNIIISALLLPQSVARQAFDRAVEHGTLLVSSPTAQELDDVVQRAKFDRYVALERRLQFVAAFIHEATLVEVTETIADCRDLKDNKFLELAVSGGATCIVSGDDDLLVLNPSAASPS